MKQHIISGEFRYCTRAMRSWLAAGYRIVKARRWGDGKYTYVLQKDSGTAKTPLDLFEE